MSGETLGSGFRPLEEGELGFEIVEAFRRRDPNVTGIVVDTVMAAKFRLEAGKLGVHEYSWALLRVTDTLVGDFEGLRSSGTQPHPYQPAEVRALQVYRELRPDVRKIIGEVAGQIHSDDDLRGLLEMVQRAIKWDKIMGIISDSVMEQNGRIIDHALAISLSPVEAAVELRRIREEQQLAESQVWGSASPYAYVDWQNNLAVIEASLAIALSMTSDVDDVIEVWESAGVSLRNSMDSLSWHTNKGSAEFRQRSVTAVANEVLIGISRLHLGLCWLLNDAETSLCFEGTVKALEGAVTGLGDVDQQELREYIEPTLAIRLAHVLVLTKGRFLKYCSPELFDRFQKVAGFFGVSGNSLAALTDGVMKRAEKLTEESTFDDGAEYRRLVQIRGYVSGRVSL